MTWTYLVQTLSEGHPRAAPVPRRFNPKTKGTILPGSRVDLVLRFLSARPGARLRSAQIARGLGLDAPAVSWPLFTLRARGLVCCELRHARDARWWAPLPANVEDDAPPGDSRHAVVSTAAAPADDQLQPTGEGTNG